MAEPGEVLQRTDPGDRRAGLLLPPSADLGWEEEPGGHLGPIAGNCRQQANHQKPSEMRRRPEDDENTPARSSSARRRRFDHPGVVVDRGCGCGDGRVATVLVTARVQDTAEQISSSGARAAAAIHTAFTVEADAKAASATDFDSWDDWERHFTQECSLIAVLFSDAEVEVVDNHFIRATGGTAFDPAAAAMADESPPKPERPRCNAWCADPQPARATDRPWPPYDPQAEGRFPDAAQPHHHRVDAGSRLPSR